ncbi:DISARM system phospholipase D-like protein DrmC [Sorangium sp. So ce1097]|uniref:DISARM system phospholipase D-like protein DrmC n=1 Tax=Sorangium sp. So ce1097 TaxID=3133330 RepID=UPI003F5E8599
MSAKIPGGLSQVPRPVLERLLESVDRGQMECPLSELELLASGYGVVVPAILDALGGLGGEAVSAALRLVLAERTHRPPPRLSLVWTGPEARGSVARDTAILVRDLFQGANRSVIVGGYMFDTPSILEPLHSAMRTRGVTVLLFLDIPGEARSAPEADAFATAAIDRFFREVWTFGSPKPDVYYDPRTAMPGPPWASLHAKCIVVDDERTLITSANFTERGQTRNVETGVLIEDRSFAEELGAQWRILIAAGLVRPYRG